MSACKVSVVIVSKNEQHYLKMTVDSFLAAENNTPLQIIVIDDASSDKSSDFLLKYPYKDQVELVVSPGLGVANARNLGASYAKNDFIVFCDSHVTVPNGWADNLQEGFSFTGADLLAPAVASLTNPKAIGFGLSLTEKFDTYWYVNKLDGPKEVPILPGGFLAVRKAVFESIGGFEKNFRVWGWDDVEITMKAWLFGYKCIIYPSFCIRHLFRSPHPYSVSAKDINHNLLWLAILHLNDHRVKKVLQKISRQPNMENIVQEVMFSSAWEKRKAYFETRQYDDDWYFEKFNIPF